MPQHRAEAPVESRIVREYFRCVGYRVPGGLYRVERVVGFCVRLRVQRGADAQRQSRRNCSSGAEGCLVGRERLGLLGAQE